MSCPDCKQLREDITNALRQAETDSWDGPLSVDKVLAGVVDAILKAEQDREAKQTEGGPFFCGYNDCWKLKIEFKRRADYAMHLIQEHGIG